jgi:adenine phosphoribosyltransferase
MFHVKQKIANFLIITIKPKIMNKQLLIDNLRCVPDFPKKGINFRDVTTLYKDAACMKEMLDEMERLYKDKGITKIVGVESRGFVMASALAGRLGCGVVLARKPGKLPATVIKESFSKEYGIDTVEMHLDSIDENDVVLIHDDLLATGGTAKAAYKLVQHFKPKKVYMNFIIEITDEGLHGRDLFEGIELTTLLTV